MKMFLVIQQDYDYVYSEAKSEDDIKLQFKGPSEDLYKFECERTDLWTYKDGQSYPMTKDERIARADGFRKFNELQYKKVCDFLLIANVGDYISDPYIIVRIKDKD